MKKRQLRHFNIEIDKLTNSIENTLSGEVFDTEITRLTKGDLKVIKKSDWLFDWRLEFNTQTTMNPLDPASLSAEQLEEVEAFLAAIDAHDDVQNVFVGLGA